MFAHSSANKDVSLPLLTRRAVHAAANEFDPGRLGSWNDDPGQRPTGASERAPDRIWNACGGFPAGGNSSGDMFSAVEEPGDLIVRVLLLRYAFSMRWGGAVVACLALSVPVATAHAQEYPDAEDLTAPERAQYRQALEDRGVAIADRNLSNSIRGAYSICGAILDEGWTPLQVAWDLNDYMHWNDLSRAKLTVSAAVDVYCPEAPGADDVE